jgi:hypothetical protein
MTTKEKIEAAFERSSHWLAEGNEASERGNKAKAERLYEKSQFWLDRAHALQERAYEDAGYSRSTGTENWPGKAAE